MHEIGSSNYIRSLQNLDPGFQIIIILNNHLFIYVIPETLH